MVIDKGAGYQDYQSSRFDGTKGPCFTDGLRTMKPLAKTGALLTTSGSCCERNRNTQWQSQITLVDSKEIITLC
jgi:hypothetical protein